ncbi:MAG: signal peptidase I [Firmicutes bacterium]|nr:signal peptidase I [Bacillota bacterium]
MKKFKEVLPYIIVVLVVILLRQFIITPIQVVGTSMNPNLVDGELMLLNKITYKFNDIERFDIVVVDYMDEPLIKRVIGLPGEKVEYKDNKLYINDELVEEKFDKNGITDDYNIIESGHTTIPNNMYFVVGDNRINSADSRVLGLIDKKIILGKANFVIFPINKFGLIK